MSNAFSLFFAYSWGFRSLMWIDSDYGHEKIHGILANSLTFYQLFAILLDVSISNPVPGRVAVE